MGENKEEYLSLLNNDLLIFIGFRNDLAKNNDNEGVKLWDELDKKMYKNKKINVNNIVLLLNNIPLYYLLSFLGYAYYKESINNPL